ncbi:hypothetical protein ACQ4PT_047920 [Festuca glaucescens]
MALRSWFFLAWWLPLAIVAAEEQAEGCSAKTCSNLTISSPLWLADMETGRSCGVMDFEVYCNSSNTTILWSSEVYGFAILDIHYEEGSLHVVDLGKLNVLNNPGRSHVLNRNTSAELGQVNASNYQELIRDGFLLTWQPPSSTGTSSGSKRGKKKLLIGGQIIIEGSWKAQTYLSSSEPAPSLTGAQHRAGTSAILDEGLCYAVGNITSGVPAFATLAGTATAGSAGLEAGGCRGEVRKSSLQFVRC